MNASGLPITQLGSTIKAHMSTAEKYAGKSEEHYKSAGLHLMEAKARIAAGEYDGKFGKFLTLECNCLSSSRAYELISIANGTKTVESLREEMAGRKRAERERDAPLRDVTDTPESHTNQPLTENKSVDSPTKRGRPPAPKAPIDILIQQLSKACMGMTIEQVRAVLQFSRTV